MKNVLLLSFLMLSIFFINAQEIEKTEETEEKVKTHELKINAFNAIVFKTIEFTYEYLLDSESSIGGSILFNLVDKDFDEFDDVLYYNEKFALTPFYRRYFSRKFAQGFYVEFFGMYNVQEDFDDTFDPNLGTVVYTSETSNNIALGLSIGGKFVSKKGFAFEWYGGIGRNLTSSNNAIATEIVPRLGASFGYRF